MVDGLTAAGEETAATRSSVMLVMVVALVRVSGERHFVGFELYIF